MVFVFDIIRLGKDEPCQLDLSWPKCIFIIETDNVERWQLTNIIVRSALGRTQLFFKTFCTFRRQIRVPIYFGRLTFGN